MKINTDEMQSVIAEWPYLAFGAAAAASVYFFMIWIGSHLNADAKNNLSKWLRGQYQHSWSSHFCILFDICFGKNHLSLKRIRRSAIASVVSVLILYLLFDRVLGVFENRTLGNLEFFEAVLLGAVINIIPDYISLIETRWILGRFGKTPGFISQLLLLICDLIFTATIILVMITAFHLLKVGSIPSLIDIVALFSVYTLFFYSTFITSIWAWLFCLSSWFVRLFTSFRLRRILDINERPVAMIALVSASLILVAIMAGGAVLKTNKDSIGTNFDNYLCEWNRETCFHTARVSGDPNRVVHFITTACDSGWEDVFECLDRITKTFSADWPEIERLLKLACDGDYAIGCFLLANSYNFGRAKRRIDQDVKMAYWRKSCDLGFMQGCVNLGSMYRTGVAGVANKGRSASLFLQACNGGIPLGCINLSINYLEGVGVEKDQEHGMRILRDSCDNTNATGCMELGKIYESGEWGVATDLGKALVFFEKACNNDYFIACFKLSQMYEVGEGIVPDLDKAVMYIDQACERGSMTGCVKLGVMYEKGKGVRADKSVADTLYRQACDAGEVSGCSLAEDSMKLIEILSNRKK